MKLFENKPIKDDDAFLEHLKKKNRIYAGVILFFGFALIIYWLLRSAADLSFASHQNSYNLGIICGVIFAFAAIIIKNLRIISDSKRLHNERIKQYDERNLAIANKARNMATLILVIILSMIALFGSFFNEAYVSVATTLLYLYLFSYLISWLIFNKTQ